MQTGCDSDRLSLYYDNMLPQDEMEAMKLHIEQCPHCTKWLAECSALSALLQEEMNPPADFSGRVLEGLPPQDKKIQTISSWRPVISFVGLAACAAIVFGLSPQTIDPTPDMIPRSTVELPSSPIVDDGASMSSSTMTEQTPPAYEYPDTDAPPPADMSPALDTSSTQGGRNPGATDITPIYFSSNAQPNYESFYLLAETLDSPPVAILVLSQYPTDPHYLGFLPEEESLSVSSAFPDLAYATLSYEQVFRVSPLFGATFTESETDFYLLVLPLSS